MSLWLNPKLTRKGGREGEGVVCVGVGILNVFSIYEGAIVFFYVTYLESTKSSKDFEFTEQSISALIRFVIFNFWLKCHVSFRFYEHFNDSDVPLY